MWRLGKSWDSSRWRWCLLRTSDAWKPWMVSSQSPQRAPAVASVFLSWQAYGWQTCACWLASTSMIQIKQKIINTKNKFEMIFRTSLNIKSESTYSNFNQTWRVLRPMQFKRSQYLTLDKYFWKASFLSLSSLYQSVLKFDNFVPVTQ